MFKQYYYYFLENGKEQLSQKMKLPLSTQQTQFGGILHSRLRRLKILDCQEQYINI
jgi:hypothetical protein